MIRIGKRKMINGKKVLMGGTLAVSVASLAVGSVALANQSAIREVETETVIIPVPSVNAEEVQKLMTDTKREIKQDQSKEIAEIKEMADEAFSEANRATFEIREITEQMNTNIEIYNNGFKTLLQQLAQTLKGLEETNRQFKEWKEGTEEALKEFKKEYEEIRELGKKWETIKAPSDINTMQVWVTEKLEPYMQEKINLKNDFDKVRADFKDLKDNFGLLIEEVDELREEFSEND